MSVGCFGSCCYCDTLSNFITWLSPIWLKLLGSPMEILVTIDNSALWQKHVAWAKPDGQELMKYFTARYSTNMVLLSLLLATEINVFFNSSQEIVNLRSSLLEQHHPLHSLHFWIGMIMLLDIFLTLLGLVTTFTLWGIISAISPINAHCLLRSTIGQYVTSLPPRLLVGALYLFWTWILLFVIDLVRSPISLIFVAVVGLLFISIIIPLSIFGRLVLHTGAMSSKPILQTDLEMQLLPSGLQASLWMRASRQQQKHRHNSSTAATSEDIMIQYQHQRTSIATRQEQDDRQQQVGSPPTVMSSPKDNRTKIHEEIPSFMEKDSTNAQSEKHHTSLVSNEEDSGNIKKIRGMTTTITNVVPGLKTRPSLQPKQHHLQDPNVIVTSSTSSSSTATSSSTNKLRGRQQTHHRRLSSNVLPPASILNSCVTRNDLRDLAHRQYVSSVSSTAMTGQQEGQLDELEEEQGNISSSVEDTCINRNNNNSNDSMTSLVFEDDIIIDKQFDDKELAIKNKHAGIAVGNVTTPPRTPTSTNITNNRFAMDHQPGSESCKTLPSYYQSPYNNNRHRRNQSSTRMIMEWVEDQDVRDLYGIAPPAALVLPDHDNNDVENNINNDDYDYESEGITNRHESRFWSYGSSSRRLIPPEEEDPPPIESSSYETNDTPLDALTLPLLNEEKRAET